MSANRFGEGDLPQAYNAVSCPSGNRLEVYHKQN